MSSNNNVSLALSQLAEKNKRKLETKRMQNIYNKRKYEKWVSVLNNENSSSSSEDGPIYTGESSFREIPPETKELLILADPFELQNQSVISEGIEEDSSDSDEHQSSSEDELTDDDEEEVEMDADPLFADSQTSSNELCWALNAVKLKHKLSNAAVRDILALFKIILPIPNKCPKSLKSFNKKILKADYGEFHKFCNVCKKINNSDSMDNYTLVVSFCNQCCFKLDSFITFSVKKQLQCILNDRNLKQIKNSLEYAKKIKEGIKSSLDGAVYQSFLKRREVLASEKLVLSFHLNTDGAPIINSKKASMWPVPGTIVELEQSTREKFENIIIFGMYNVLI